MSAAGPPPSERHCAKRVGLLVPASNSVLEPDLARAFAGWASVHTARMFLTDPINRASEIRMLDEETEPAARMIAQVRPDVVIFGCTSAGSIRGAGADAALRRRLSEVAGARVLGVMESIRASLRTRRARRVALVTPYPPEMTAEVARGLRELGVDVVDSGSLGESANDRVSRIAADAILAAARRVSATAGAEALVVACTNLPALAILDRLEEVTQLPTVTANSAIVEAARLALGAS